MEYSSALKGKEENPAICNNMNETVGHYVKKKKTWIHRDRVESLLPKSGG